MSILQAGLNRRILDPSLDNWVPMPNHVSLTSSDVSEVQHHLSGRLFPHMLTQAGRCPISFRHHYAVLGGMSFSYTDYGAAASTLRVLAPSMGDIFTINLTLSGTAHINCGGSQVVCQPGDLTIIEPGETFSLMMSGDFRPLYLMVSRQALERSLGDILGYQLQEPLQLDKQQCLTSDASSHIARIMLSICTDLSSEDPTYLLPKISERVEELMLCTLVTQMRHNYSHTINGGSVKDAPFYIKRAMRYIAANAREDVSLDDIVTASGMSARSLYAGFRRYVNDTPTGFLKTLRLQMARAELMKSEGRFVTEIAISCGFTQLSKFASDYKKRFGISPSQTRSTQRDMAVKALGGMVLPPPDSHRAN